MWEVWGWRVAGVAFAGVSAFGWLNVLVLRNHGPGGDAGVVGGLLAWGCFHMARRARTDVNASGLRGRHESED